MSETDFARSWRGFGFGMGTAPLPTEVPRGGEAAYATVGREPAAMLSARDLSCSDQLKPCWSDRADIKSEAAL